MADVKKVTKKDYFEALKAVVAGEAVEIAADELTAFIDKQIEQIDNKAAKAKERAGQKKAEGDALRETVLANVTDEFQTADAITAAIGDEEVTKSKVVARLGQLVAIGAVIKEQTKVGDAKRMTYKLASDADVAEDEVEE